MGNSCCFIVFLPFNHTLSLLLLLCSLAGAIYYAVLTLPAMAFLLFMLVVAVAVTLLRHRQQKWRVVVMELLLLLGCIALLFHVSGFNNFKILDKVQVGMLSGPFSMYYNFDKALIPFFVLICLPDLFTTQKHPSISQLSWIGLMCTVPALLLLAVAIGGLKIEFHFPQWIGQFFIANVFFVCLAEEALFRGYLQRRLSQWLGAYPALLCSALVFGAYHFAGGSSLIIFATLAGIIYGLAWLWSGRLWVAVSFHFAFNLIHLLFFTYPIYLPK